MTGRSRIILVVNPTSNKGFGLRIGQRVAEHLGSLSRLRVLSGRSQAESVSLLARAAEDADAVVVCGGDGIVLSLDEQVLELAVTLVAIGNGPRYGGGKLITPPARMDDGIFDVTVVGPLYRLTLARLAPRLPSGGHIGHPAVSQHRSRSVGLSPGDPDVPDTVAYADGERVGALPVRTTCVPAALAVLVPIGPVPPGLTSTPLATR